MQILENVYLVPQITAHSYILVDPDGLTLVDTGMPYSQKKTLEYMARHGWSARDVKRILITHADLDHYGCLMALQQASGACSFAGQAEAEAMAKGQSSRPVNRSVGHVQHFMIQLMGKLLKATPAQVDQLLVDGQVLPVLGGLRVVATPGHSPDHLSYFAPAAGILFCGDSMRSGEKGLRGSRSRNDWDREQANASVRKQAQLGARIVCPGHGPVVFEAAGKFPA